MTMQLWEQLREIMGLPGKARVIEIPSEKLALFFSRQRQDETTEQERAGFGCPTPRRNYHAEI